MVPMESRDSEGVPFAIYIVWRVCDQAFGRHRPLKGAESGHVTITKIEISTQTDVEEFTDSKNVIHFDL